MFGFVVGTLCLVGLFKVTRGGGRWSGGRWGGGRRRWMLRWLFERLETSPGQEKVISQSVEEVQEAARKAGYELRNFRPDLARAMRGESLDHEVLKQLFLRQDQSLDEVRRTALVALSKVHEALEPRQREELASIIERAPMWMGHGHDRGHGCRNRMSMA